MSKFIFALTLLATMACAIEAVDHCKVNCNNLDDSIVFDMKALAQVCASNIGIQNWKPICDNQGKYDDICGKNCDFIKNGETTWVAGKPVGGKPMQ